MARPGQTPTTRLFKSGTKSNLFVTSVQPGAGRFCHFWAQIDIETQLEVENLMNAAESKVASTSCPQIVHKDELCLAKFQEDGKWAWYRGKVLDCKPGGSRSRAKVFFLDYGNSEIVPLVDIRTNMHDYFANYPPQAKEFVLADLHPSDGIHWSEREVDHLTDQLAYGEFSGHILAAVCGQIPLVRLMSNEDKTQPLVAKFPSVNIGKSYNNNHFLTSEYPQMELPPSSDLDAFVTYSLSPVKFWIQLESAEEQLNQLRVEMERRYGNLSDRDLVCNFIDEGTLCAGVCSIDGSFYRAVIEECRTDGLCRTFFIDYGNSETASIQKFKFKILPDELKHVPAHAFECTLAGIPPGMLMTDTHIAIFRDLVNDIVVKARVCSVNADGVYSVALFDTNGNSIVDVMKLGSIRPLQKVVPIVKPQPVQKPQIPAANCVVGTEEEVFITMAESPDKFFGQLCKYSAEGLDVFQNTLMEHYEAHIAHIPPISSPSIGDVCCAKYAPDDGWYRAQVEAIAGSKFDLFFIDYGDKDNDVPLAEVKTLDPKFFGLPQQGILLKMAEPVDKTKFKEIIDRRITVKLEKNLGGNFYSATFSKKNEANILQLLLEPQAPTQSPAMQRAHFKEVVIDPAQAEGVTVTHVNNPDSFYCQLSKTEEALNQLMDEIHNVYSKLGPMDGLLQTVVPGTPCVAQFTEDDGWYRANVLANQGNLIKVLYVDYGNSEDIDKKRVRIMDPRFLILPAQAVHCSMHSIKYVGSWPPECVAQFEEMVVAGPCTASFLGFDDKQSTYATELLDANGVNINEKFGKATRTLDRAAPTPPAQVQAPRSPQRRPPGIMYQKVELIEGSFKDIDIVHTENPSDFYCQLTESAPALSDVMDRIEAVYSQFGPTDHSVRNPVKGMPCCAQFTEDDVWYRAEITDILGNILTVQFVDYGNGESLTSERVKELKPDFLQLPAQAIKCCLREISPRGGEWSDAAIDQFINLTDGKSLISSVIKRLPDGTLEIELIDTSNGGDLNVGRELSKLADCIGSSSMPVAAPLANANAMRSRSSSSSSSNSNPPRPPQRTSPQQAKAPERGGSSNFGGRQPSGGRSSSNDWREEPSGNKFLDRLAGDEEEQQQPYKRPEWPGERESKGRSVGNGDFKSQGSNQGDDRSFGKREERSGFGGTQRSYGKTEELGPVPPYKDIDLSIGKKTSLLIKWTETACDFVCQLVDIQQDVGKMMVSIQSEYNKKRSEYASSNPTTGSPCMALYAGDRAWYRGKVISVEFKSCKVLFVDYGNQEEVQKSNVLKMKPEYMSLPIQGIRCQLKGVKPVSDKWSGESKRKCEKIMNDAQPLQCVIKEKKGDIFLIESDVTSAMLSAGLISSTSSSPAPVVSAPAPVVSAPAITATPSGSKKYLTAYKRGRHQGFISQLDSPGKFFMQVKDEEPLVAKITKELVRICNGPEARRMKVNNAPPVGSACIAKYADDGAHYRAVVESHQGSMLCVRFVDFGNAETVELSEILSINDSLLSQSPLAYECTFAAGSTWSETDGDKMHALTSDRELTVEFVSSTSPFVVKLFEGQTDIGSQFKPESTASVSSSGYPSKNITSQREVGYVSHVENLNSFYIQLASEEDKLAALSDQLQESYESGSTPLTQAAVGTPGVTRFSEDSCWYRAVVTKIAGGQASVRFVDYGNGEDVQVQDIKTLKSEFCTISPYAVQCSLRTGKTLQADVEKFSELTADKQLNFQLSSSDPYVVKVFEGTVDLGAAFTSAESAAPVLFPTRNIVCGVHEAYVSHIENPDKFFIQLASEEGQLELMTTALTEVTLADLPEMRLPKVGSACIAEFSDDGALYRGVVTKVLADKAEVIFIDFGNTDTLPFCKIRAASNDFVKKVPIAIECSLGVSKTFDQGSIDKFSAEVMDIPVNVELITNSPPCKVKLTVDGTDIASSLNMVVETVKEYPERGVPKTPMNGFTSHVESVKQFYIQLAGDEGDLETIGKTLNTTCEGLPRVTNAAVGTLCGSKFTEDEMWYRAKVISILPGNKAKVVFVDYGNTDTVDISSLRILPVDILQKPALAFECKLEEGVESTQENMEKLTHMTADQELKVEFLTSARPVKVRLVVGGKDVAELLAGDPSPAADSPKYPEYAISGNQHKAGVCHDESPGKFYIQLASDDAKLNELMDQLDGHYSANAKVMPQVAEGDACVCMYSEDQGWYRGRVVAKCGNKVTVQFVDYGNCEDKLVTEVYSLSEQLAVLPPFALECTIGNATFTDADTEKFHNLTSDKELDVTFVSHATPYTVQLSDGASDLNGEFKKESPSGVPASSTPALQYSKQVITVGTHNGYVSHVEDLTEFYIQLESQEDALNILAEQLDAHYSADNATKLETFNFESCKREGVACATLYSADQHWYRGKIVGIGHDIVTVQFIDYGNSEEQSLESVKVLAADFISQPPFAYRCSVGEKATFTPADTETFTEQTAEKLVAVDFVTSATPYNVKVSVDSECLTAKYLPDGPIAVTSEEASDVTQITLMKIPEFPVGAFISHINSPVSFYLQFKSAETDLNNLMEKISSVATQPLQTDISVGSFCLAKYSADDGLYRAEVLSQEGDEVSVLFIDYGNREKINKVDLSHIGTDIAAFQRFAVHCKLSGISWQADQEDDQLHNYQEKELTVVFDSKTEPCCVTLLDDDKDLKELFNSATEETSQPEQTSEADTKTDASAPSNKYFKYQQFPVESSEELYVAVTKSVGQFWCQKSSCEGQLAEITENILADEGLKSGTMTVDDVHVGAAYLAKFIDDDLWYRATVLKMDAESCSVLFVDYGNQEDVLYENISPIDDKYLQLPACAIECSLHGASWSSSSEATEKFTELVVDKAVQAQCLKSSQSTLGTGLDKFAVSIEVDGVDLLENLIEDGLAKAVTDMEEAVSAVTQEASSESTEVVDLRYTKTHVQLENKYEVIVSFVTSPSQFWLQCSNDQGSLDELMGKLEERYAELGEEDRGLQNPSPRQPCVVKYSEDEAWYRGRIEKVLEDNKVDVFFVDYGNSEETSLTNVKVIEPSFVEQPLHALECFHAGMKSIQGPWAAEAIELFSNLVQDKKLICEFISQEVDSDCDNPYIVQLRDMGISVVDKMVEAGVAERTGEELSHFLDASLVETEAATPPETEGAAAENNVPAEITSAEEEDSEVITHYVEYKMPQLEPGSKIDVFITSVTNPTDFWCQLADSSEDLPLLMDTFHEYCNDNDDAKLDQELVNSLPCIACTQEGEDQAWYRAKVIEAREEDVHVCFVDYGNTEDIPRDKLYKLQQEHTELPLQAFRCCLKDVKPSGDNSDWDESACTRFEELTYDKKLKLEITDLRGKGPVFGLLEEGEESILRKLIDEGYAEVQQAEEAFTLADDDLEPKAANEDALNELHDAESDTETEVAAVASKNDDAEAEPGTEEADVTSKDDDSETAPEAEVADVTTKDDDSEAETDTPDVTSMNDVAEAIIGTTDVTSKNDVAETDTPDVTSMNDDAEAEIGTTDVTSKNDVAETDTPDVTSMNDVAEAEIETPDVTSKNDVAETAPEVADIGFKDDDSEAEPESEVTDDTSQNDDAETASETEVANVPSTNDDSDAETDKKLESEVADTTSSKNDDAETASETEVADVVSKDDDSDGEPESEVADTTSKDDETEAEPETPDVTSKNDDAETAFTSKNDDAKAEPESEETDDTSDNDDSEETDSEIAEADATSSNVESTEVPDTEKAPETEEAGNTIEIEEAAAIKELDDVLEKSSEDVEVSASEGQVDEAIKELDDVLQKEDGSEQSDDETSEDEAGKLVSEEQSEAQETETDTVPEDGGAGIDGAAYSVGEEQDEKAKDETSQDGEEDECEKVADVDSSEQIKTCTEVDDDSNLAVEEHGDDTPDAMMQELARKTVEGVIQSAKGILQTESDLSVDLVNGIGKLVPLPIITNEKLAVDLTVATSPLDFYLQPKDQLVSPATLKQDLASYCEKEEAVESSLDGDDVCLALDGENQWSRARITSKEEEKYKVFFIDTGFERIVTSDQTRVLPDKFQHFPCQAVHCQLDGLKETACSDDVLESFKGMCAGDLRSRFVTKMDNGCYSVYLYEKEDDDVSINKRLMELSINKRLMEEFNLDGVAGSELVMAADSDDSDTESEEDDAPASEGEAEESQVNGLSGEEEDETSTLSKSVAENVEPAESADDAVDAE